MRLLSYSVDGRPSFGKLNESGSGVIDLAHGEAWTLSHLLEANLLDWASEVDNSPDYNLDEVSFERVIKWPRKIFCIDNNYPTEAVTDTPEHSKDLPPLVFIRTPDSLVGHTQALVRPTGNHQLDYEGEMVVVIGKAGRRIEADDALAHIAGITLGNDGTVRDASDQSECLTPIKNWEASGSVGPWLTTLDEIEGFDSLQLTTTVNGEKRQDESSASMHYPIATAINYLSTITTLYPGDMIFTGTPPGFGAHQDPPRWLKPGDILEVSASRLGKLENSVINELPRLENADET